MSGRNYGNTESASQILESVLEDMNNIMKGNENIEMQSTFTYTEIGNGNNNCLEVTPDRKFELMLEELQKCLKETADTRNVMQNLSSDKRDFVRSLIRTDNDVSMQQNKSLSHKVDLMDEISKLKLDIAYLQRDKQNLLNQITDLNGRVEELSNENHRLRQDVSLMKVEEIDYCIPPTESGDDLNSVDESFHSRELIRKSPIATSTPDKSKISTNMPTIPPHGGSRRQIPAESVLNGDLPFRDGVMDYSGKACSWSELRTNQIMPSDLSAMTPPTHRKSSVNSNNRSHSFGKGDTKSNGLELRKKMKLMSNKRSSQPVSIKSRVGDQPNPGPLAPPTGHFTRQHPLRMTAGPRLLANGNSNSGAGKNQNVDEAMQRILSRSNPNLQTITMLPSRSDFRLWTRDHVCALLHQLGLGAYANNCRRWLENGQQLIEAGRKEIDKELNMTNKLHLKKLLIHVRQLTSMHVPSAAYFNLSRPGLLIANNFSTRLWLDDVGLLQYMSTFVHNNVDGFVLDQLTLEDLQHLKITNELHVMSIKRGIQLLREVDYDLSRLIRRPTEGTFSKSRQEQDEDDEEEEGSLVCCVSSGEICRWSQHQVMEWLRLIELPEYAANIRGAGIHGALLVLEDRFTATSLASVLNIPQNKTLLRRHLQAKFQELIGPEVHAKKKRAAEADFLPLNITAKMKYPRKKSFFNVIKRKSPNEAAEEILVPYTLRITDIDLMLNQESFIQNNDSPEIDNNEEFVLPNTDL